MPALLLLAVAGCDEQSAAPTVESRIEAAVDDQLDVDPVYDNVRAVIVNVDEETVFERYYGTAAEEYWPIQSVTKSVVSTLVGIAVDQQLLRLDQPLAELLPSYRDQMHPRQAGLTLEQVLTMTAGFPPDTADPKIFERAEDPVSGSLRMWDEESVGAFEYSDAGAHLLSAILVEATGRSVLDFAREALLDPLGVDTEPAGEPLFEPAAAEEYFAGDFAWPVDPQGRHLGHAWLKLTPADMMRLGELYLADGSWDGKQVMSSEWVDAATSRQVDTAGTVGVLGGYGYEWWVGELEGEPAALAWGYGGQAVAVVPTKELVVVVVTEVDFMDKAGPTTRGLSSGQVMTLIEAGVMRNLDP